MGIFKKNKIDSKYKIGEFVGFHMDNELKHGVIKNIKKNNDIIYYDINVGGEATWLAKDIDENKILKLK